MLRASLRKSGEAAPGTSGTNARRGPGCDRCSRCASECASGICTSSNRAKAAGSGYTSSAASATRSENDRAADWPAPGVQGAHSHAAASRSADCSATRPADRQPSRARTSRSRPADFSASASRRWWTSRIASAVASRRAPAHAPNANRFSRTAANWRRPRIASARTNASWKPSWWSVAQARPALCSARGKRRPHEGLRASATALAFE